MDESGRHSLAELRSFQDWYLKYYLKSVPGVAEVAPVGGFGKQYQVNVDPNRLQAYGLSINKVVEAVRAGNYESSGRLVEFGGTEYSIRGRGYVKSVQDLEQIAVTTSLNGTPDPAHGHRRGGARPRHPPRPRRPGRQGRRRSRASSSCATGRTRST